MERPTGPPMGAATLSSGRSGMPRPPPNSNAFRRGPMVRHAQSSSSLSSQIPRSEGQVIALAREAMNTALEENRRKAAETSAVSNELRPGVTIDLSHKQIQRFPDEVVDIIKNELERLALSHNLISIFPTRFAECTSLRYLNVRNNVIREFPLPICQLASLEILDLGRNKLRVLPPEIVKLTSLKVLSIQKNRIEELPLCLAEMTSLQVLKLEGNQIRFPPKEVLQPQAATSPNGAVQEGEMGDITVTTQIKRFMKQKAMADRSENESGGEESSEGTETPRPLKRVVSGRFPIRVDVPGSPAQIRPPPIPSRSHQRGYSQQNAALRRPGVMPLTIGSTNERLRSNSESLMQASNRERSERAADRSRRMGIVSKKLAELETVQEANKQNRYSQHIRGLSHGSAMQGGSTGANGNNSTSPASPADSAGQRATYVRRLSSLPERKRESNSPDPIIEGAKGILYALFQVHPLIETLLGLARNPGEKKPSLERVFYNVKTHVEELDRDVHHYDTYSEEDEEISPRSNENVKRACLTCVNAYIHVCALLSQNVQTLLINGDPRYIRTLLLQMYGSVAEVRNAGASLFPPGQRIARRTSQSNDARYHSRDKSITPTRERPGTSLRTRSATVIQHSNNLRVAIEAPAPPYIMNGGGRSATMTSATPRSGESFVSTGANGRMAGVDFNEEDRIFERLFLHLQQTTEMAMRTLPTVNNHFLTAMNKCAQQANPDQPKSCWQILVRKCTHALYTADTLKTRLSQIKLKEPGVRTQSAFWELCTAFIDAYTDLVIKVKEAKGATTLLPTEVIVLLRPLQKAVKEAGQQIQTSPWSYLAGRHASNGVSNGSYTTQSPASQTSLPMTPQSAALGPAVQATVPSTPQSASFSGMYGNAFDRAETLLSMNGSSRNGTMTSSLDINDGPMRSMLSPLNGMGVRYNGNGKLAF